MTSFGSVFNTIESFKKSDVTSLDSSLDNLTDLSKNEQKNAGLDNCTKEEYSFFQKMNNEFKLKFDIPFIFAVKGSNKNIIIEEFKRRLMNENIDIEFNESIKQVKKIATFRLEDNIDD